MSLPDLEPFVYLWKASAWDRAECITRDADGNPTEVRFYRRKKHILSIFVAYDTQGDWKSIWTEKPKKEKKKK